MPRSFVKYRRTNERPFRLVAAKEGMHAFGGKCEFSGIVPKDCDVPIQQLLLIDLRDPDVPFAADSPINYLPILYPFKYGCGGPEIQYAVISDTEIEILYLSDPTPDEPEWQYIQVAELPKQPLAIEALTYEEARCLTFMREDGYFQPNTSDLKILKRLGLNSVITFGGRRNYIENAPKICCRNPTCQQHGEPTYFKLIATVPPIAVNGQDDFWYEFQGGGVDFCFGICHYCGTIIGFNVAD